MTKTLFVVHRSAKFVLCIVSITFALFTVYTPHVSAAVISFDPQETTVGIGTPFLVGMTVDADKAVNAFSVVVNIPEAMEVIDASDGNSVINMWVERPHLNDAGQLVFSGIIPGGYEGVRGKLITLTMRASREGRGMMAISPSSRVYESAPDAPGQAIISAPVMLHAVRGKDNLINDIPDTDAPETFTPELVQLQSDDGPWMVTFQAQDKGSGIDRYEVAESHSRIAVDSTRRLAGLAWSVAQSPVMLADQRLTSYVYVKAVDKSGNERVARLEPAHPDIWRLNSVRYILIALIALTALYVLSKRFHIAIRI